MIYYLFQWLDDFGVPGARLMDYITFRSGCALVLSLFIAVIFGRKIIDRLQMMQVGEIIRDLGLEGQMKKTGTPTMGGVIIIIAILVPCLLVGNIGNVYMALMLIATLWLGVLGGLDDYIKVHRHDKDGLKGKFKIVGQIGLGLMVGLTMVFSPDIVMRENVEMRNVENSEVVIEYVQEDVKTPQTTIPFVKNNNFDYSWLTSWMGRGATAGGWILFVLVVIFVVTATSNGANLTDGLDGLATGTSAIIGTALAIMAYLGANIIYSSYLNIMYIPGSEELVVYMAAFIGALVGFLWYNAYPAQVFMGDTGSLTIGGIIAVFAILIRKELLLPILCAIFFIEDLSVIIQVAYFKITKKRYGEGRRVFKMTPLHHHFQKQGGIVTALIQKPMQAIPESKIVTRFWIVGIMLAVITFVTLKIR
ncbi:phospho-N-acetylmuramoyl-pentapeptide-transferase [Muribaculum intestinale]|mgnify:FL=1|uniref:Phospho-N-acetylmuramoyl-pentapeptide-transferase n=1 Tax=Muribaculum intestinale TaxID=1796646 RepID=A0A4S2FLX1_9BACT|nr:phospho-N-acetylmuramoyl-pentapeptide-transferase [Muribaculum intestinale]MCX4368304.1 phospho-N-acetylmuramoyl-pentapeptide-transferase [Duncaniella sp.]ROS82388.1 phospho-N-acetylmuramoyl-pentapeptide-transferase [Muribaculaceae bacterium Isolate-042 (Harlan)]MYM11206.1 phospho-N-acetylmuramoyl-pentapeptide-transferase [Muribaculum intestinale]TGX87699.1 phospho-N-acetylmuramoyl-pentapeptide-transferase [Muribaculum intestinale]TGY70010.1 phospho-N-acetylmuramoyl-pentapeptide-transferase